MDWQDMLPWLQSGQIRGVCESHAWLNVEEIRVPSEKGVVLSGLIVRREDITTENTLQTILIYFQGQILLLITYHGSYSGTGNTGNPLHRFKSSRLS